MADKACPARLKAAISRIAYRFGVPLSAVALLMAAAVPATGTTERQPAKRDGAPRGAVEVPGSPSVSAREPGRELKELRTSHSRTFAGEGGTRLARVFPGPVNFKDPDGDWRPIENELVAADGGYRNRANAFSVKLPSDLGSEVRATKGDESIAFSLDGAKGDATVKGASARYERALAGVDVVYTATNAGLKEDLILTGADAPTAFSFSVRTSDGLVAKENGAGGVSFETAGGRQLASFAPPFMYQGERGERAYSDDVSLDLERAGGGYQLKLRADEAWVREHAKRGPVVIDPTLSFVGAEQDCTLRKDAPDASQCLSAVLDLAGGSKVRRSLLRFDVQDYLPRSIDVLNAKLGLYAWGRTTSNNFAVSAHKLTRSWTTGATWNRQDGTSGWITAGGDFDASAADTNSSVGTTTGWEHWYPTALVQEWVDGKPNHGLLLRQTGTESVENTVSFDSTEYKSSSTWPVLDVTYEPRTGRRPQYQFEEEPMTDRMRTSVNVANGNLLVEENDLQIAGTGLRLGVSRAYNNLDRNANRMGGGWVMYTGQDIRLEPYETGDVAFHGPSGYVKTFKKQADGSYKKPSGLNLKLEKQSDGTFKLTVNKTDEKLYFKSDGLLDRHENRNGQKLSFAYNAYKDLTQITDTQGRLTKFTYDKYGYRTSMTDPAGQLYTYKYDGKGQLTTYWDATGTPTNYFYDQYGNLLQINTPRVAAEGPGTVQIAWTYDAENRVTSVTRTGGHTSTYAYEQAGTKCGDTKNTVVTDPRGNKTTYCWDDEGRVDEVYDALGRKRAKKYDADSNVTEYTGAGGSAAATPYGTKASYDSNSNLTSVEQPGGALSSFGYGTGSEAFKLKDSTDPEGSKRNFNYDTDGDLTKVGTTTSTGAAETLATVQYNGKSDGDCADQAGVPKGTLRCSIDGNSNRTTYEHDGKGNLTKITPPSPLGAITYTYDTLSRVSSITDGKGQKRSISYDRRDRITKVEHRRSDGTLESTVSYGYDADGNRTSRTDPQGTTSYRYDGRNLLVEEAFPGAKTNRMAYDAAKNLASFTDPGGQVLYAYNEVNMLTELTDPDAKKTTFAYNSDNSRIRTSFPNGVTETRDYTQAERVKLIEAKNASGTLLTKFRYDYLRASGRESHLRQKMHDDERSTTTSYGYDHLARLAAQATSGAVSENYSYRYDANSNRLESANENGTTTSYSYNAANQITSAGGVSFDYDKNGNLLGSSDGYQFAYNARNQTTSITPPGGAAQQMKYLGAGQTELVDRAGTAYVNNGLGPGQSAGQRGSDFYVRDNRGLLQSQKSPAGRHYYLTDGHPGSVAALADGSGNVAARYRYDPFGQDKGQTGALGNSLRFTAAEYAESLKLYKMGERWYDPKHGRFTQQDPLNQALDPRQSNRYLYAGQDPVNLLDPTGLHGSVQIEAGAGPFGVSYGENADGSAAGFDYSFEGGLADWRPTGFKLGLGFSGTASTGHRDGGGVGVEACWVACVGANTDTGVSFGGGLDFGLEISLG